jgi:hypothetical protein
MSGRPVRAFLLAPLAAPAACALALLADTIVRGLIGSSSPPSARSSFELVMAVGTIGVPLAYGAALLVGAPLYVVLRRFGAVTRWTVWLGAAAIGAVLALFLEPRLHGDLFSLPFPWWVGAALGLVSGEAFWRLLAAPNESLDGLPPAPHRTS